MKKSTKNSYYKITGEIRQIFVALLENLNFRNGNLDLLPLQKGFQLIVLFFVLEPLETWWVQTTSFDPTLFLSAQQQAGSYKSNNGFVLCEQMGITFVCCSGVAEGPKI